MGKKSLPFVGMHNAVIFGCPEWARLSPAAKDLYLLLKGKWNPYKGEEISLSHREVLKHGHRGLKSFEAVNWAFKELEENGGWIERVKLGGLLGQAQTYRLTWKYDHYGRERGRRKR